MQGLKKEDLQSYFGLHGKIVDMDFQSDNCRAFIAFSSCDDAQFVLKTEKR
jgi:RNA recognition motif-containing protein